VTRTSHSLDAIRLIDSWGWASSPRGGLNWWVNWWVKTSVTHLFEQLQLESVEKRRKVQRLAFMYKNLNGQVAVPAASLDLILSSRPSRGTDANQQKLFTVWSHTENYRQSYSIRTVKDWNSLPQSVVSAGSLALFKSRLTSHVAPWLHSPSVWCPCQGLCRLLIQIQIQDAWLNCVTLTFAIEYLGNRER